MLEKTFNENEDKEKIAGRVILDKMIGEQCADTMVQMKRMGRAIDTCTMEIRVLERK